MFAHRWLHLGLLGTVVCSTGTAGPRDDLKGERKEPTKDAKVAGKPLLVPTWKKTTVGLAKEDDPYSFDIFAPAQERVGRLYAEIVAARKAAGKHLIPPAVPAAVGDIVCCSTDRTEAVFALRRTSQTLDEIPPAALGWESIRFRSLVYFARELTPRLRIEPSFKSLSESERQELLVNNTLARAIELDKNWVRRVDEAAEPLLMGQVADSRQAKDFDELLNRNALESIELDTGKINTRIPRSVEGIANETSPPVKFMGLQLARGDRWYCIYESGLQVRACCWSWRDYHELSLKLASDYASKSLVWDTRLVQSPTSLAKEPCRRVHAINLIESDGLILYPTHLGRVVAVESKTGKIQWTHEYAPLDAKRFPTFAPEWVVVPPVAVGDKYIYAPADFPELLCLNVADGKKIWSVKKDNGLYPAVAGDQVLVIGEKTLRSLDLKDGSEKWKLDLPGLPCGRGAILGDSYLVPVSEPKTWRGMIAMVDVKNGKITEVLKPDKDEPIGNLVVHQDFLISQTLTEIAVFPIKK